VTRGDEVAIAGTNAQKIALIGRVDNVGEAKILAQFAGYGFGVTNKFRQTAKGYELTGRRGDCNEPSYFVHLTVALDGTVSEQSRGPSEGISLCKPDPR